LNTEENRGAFTSRPVPDPTLLTTEQLLREVAALRELVESDIEGLEAIVAEKFRSVDQQLELVERQRVEQKADTKAAVDAALTAQKEAVKEQTTASDRAIAKSEASMTKQLEQLSATFAASIKSVVDSLDDMKQRVGSIEAMKQGGKDTVAGVYAFASVAIGVVGLIVAAFVATH
jgi:DNA anti-recombination protein RmuC